MSTYHLAIKFSTLNGIGCVRSEQYIAKDCNYDTIKERRTWVITNALPVIHMKKEDKDEKREED